MELDNDDYICVFFAIFLLIDEYFEVLETKGESASLLLRSSQHKAFCLANFLIGRAKMSIWLTRRTKMKGPAEPLFMWKGLAAARLKVEFMYYKLASDLQEFVSIWGTGSVFVEFVLFFLFRHCSGDDC